MKVLALVCIARVAYADDAGYATLDRQDRSTKLGAAVTYSSVPHQGQWARLDLAAQYVNLSSGLGVYAQAPVLAYSSDSGGNTNYAIGGLELGGIIAPASGVVLHAGLVLPTASTDIGASTILGTAVARLHDLPQALPNTMSLRGAIAYGFRSCQMFGRIELGVDTPLSTDGSGGPTIPGTFLRLDAAIGFDADDFMLAVESSNTFAIGDTTATYDVVAATIRLRGGIAQPYLAAVVPLDSQSSEPQVAFIAGVDLRFGP